MLWACLTVAWAVASGVAGAGPVGGRGRPGAPLLPEVLPVVEGFGPGSGSSSGSGSGFHNGNGDNNRGHNSDHDGIHNGNAFSTPSRPSSAFGGPFPSLKAQSVVPFHSPAPPFHSPAPSFHSPVQPIYASRVPRPQPNHHPILPAARGLKQNPSVVPKPSTSRASTSFAPVYTHFDCGTDQGDVSLHLLTTIQDLHTSGNESLVHFGSNLRTSRKVAPINVDLYLHVVQSAAHVGMITPAMVTAQFNTMNKVYNPHGIYFTLRGSDFTTNDAWAVGATDDDDDDMKSALRKGTYAALNIYLQTDLANNILGKCTFPTDVGAKPPANVYTVDGCNVAAGTVPGGPIYGYNLGMTAVHESGHWFGLLHTFEGYSCSGSGDFIADTNAESQSTDGCPTKPAKNTCGGFRKGVDPIHNYMDYSVDSCYSTFTAGQETRMRNLWKAYRLGN